MEIWAHRGCSQLYPENTLTSFEKAMNIKGVAGIELDVQLTKDDELVVIHDEKVDRTTDGFGFVRDYTLKELKQLHIFSGIGGKTESIPTMKEVLELLQPKLKAWGDNPSDGIRLNIELKTSVYNYPGIEKNTVELVHEFGVQDSIVYSSFSPESLVKVHEVDPKAELGVLDDLLSNCLYKAIGLESLWDDLDGRKLALHPWGNKMDMPLEKIAGRTVRGWFTGHLFPEKPTGGKMDIDKYARLGLTDAFLNEPDKYL